MIAKLWSLLPRSYPWHNASLPARLWDCVIANIAPGGQGPIDAMPKRRERGAL